MNNNIYNKQERKAKILGENINMIVTNYGETAKKAHRKQTKKAYKLQHQNSKTITKNKNSKI